jgi:hypothetical protein
MTLSMDIVVPSCGRPARAKSLAQTLCAQSRPGDTVVVVAQGKQIPAHLPSGVRLLTLRKPNLPAARNAALAASNADVVLFLDDDIVPAENLVEAHRACYSDPVIAGVAGFVDDPLFDRTQPLPSAIDLATGDCVQNFSLARSCRTASVMGANMSFRRSALLDIGGFDEHYLHNALWEEVDASLRLLTAGFTLWYCAEARVTHERDKSGGCRSQTGRRYLHHQFANTAYFAARFAAPRYRGSWFAFWKHRLEYLSRKQLTAPTGRHAHDAAAIVCGVCGAASGISRFFLSRLFSRGGIKRVDRNALAAALAALESGVCP